MSSDEGCAGILGILIIAAIAIAVIVYVILPLTVLVLGSVTIVGVVSGAVVAGKNFREVIIEAHQTIR